MTVIKAKHDGCGDVELTAAQIRLTDGPRDVDGNWTGAYAFTCTVCGARVSKTADAEVVALLKTGGVRVEHIPAEVWERHPTGPITYDDRLEFMTELRNGDLMGVLEREGGA